MSINPGETHFLEDRVLVAGLSNEEFASTLRAIPFPFKVGNQPSLLAAYTCTPLVQFPLSELQPGAKIKGKTIAELGNRNRPLDMIVYQKDGKDFLLLANSSRGIMKMSTDRFEQAESITAPVADKQGVGYETIASWTGIEQLDRFDAQNALVVRRGDGGSVNLESLPLP